MKLRNYFDEYCIRDVTTGGKPDGKSELNGNCPCIDLNYTPISLKFVDSPFCFAELKLY